MLPEAFLGGYPKGLAFGISVGSRTPSGRDPFRRYHAAAIEVPGPEVEHLASALLAASLDVENSACSPRS
ncbi:hypothetical protein WB401_07970 [Streptomyces brasiliscabiei]|uniref:Uncharacterized protein n=1 Tax=Streptomyces brasiliscabiei TaxID=2736302 RepID=A0ABU8G6H6_9ACTN